MTNIYNLIDYCPFGSYQNDYLLIHKEKFSIFKFTEMYDNAVSLVDSEGEDRIQQIIDILEHKFGFEYIQPEVTIISANGEFNKTKEIIAYNHIAYDY